MIFCNDKIYAKVWKSTPNEKYLDLQITTSEKDKEGKYINSSWFPRAIGHAMNSLKNVQRGDKIIITRCKLSNEMYVDKSGNKKNAFRMLILEAEVDGSAHETAKPQAEEKTETTSASEDCPW